MIIRLFYMALLLLSLSTFAQAQDWMALAKEMAQDDGEMTTGDTDESGLYILVINPIKAVNDSAEKNRALAEIEAKRKIAGFVSGEKIASSESAETVESTVSVDGKEQYASQEVFRQKMSVKVDAFLSGIQILGTVKGADTTYLVALACEKRSNQATVLADAMSQTAPNTVVCMGMAAINDGRIDQAKSLALEKAKQSAIEQVLGATLSSTGMALDGAVKDKVATQALGCIKHYRILTEGDNGAGFYSIKIAAEVAKDELLESYGAISQQLGGVTFYVKCDNLALRTLLTEKFVAWGCDVVKDRNLASYVLLCKGNFSSVTHPSDGRDGTRLTFRLDVTSRQTGEVCLSAMNDARKSVSFIGSKSRQRQLAVEMAADEIHGKIHTQLNQMMGKMAAQGREIVLVIDGYTSSSQADLKVIMTIVHAIPGTKDIRLREDTNERQARITCKFPSDINAFSDYFFKEQEKHADDLMAVEKVSTTESTLTVTW